METLEKKIEYQERANNRQSFDKRQVAFILEEVKRGVPRREILVRHGLSASTLGLWLSQAGGTTKKTYSVSQKRSLVRAIEQGMSINEAKVAFGISSRNTIKHWIQVYSSENTDLSELNAVAMSKKKSTGSESTHIQALQKALAEAQLQNKALNTLIDIAEEKLKIDIRKKSGAKQSSK